VQVRICRPVVSFVFVTFKLCVCVYIYICMRLEITSVSINSGIYRDGDVGASLYRYFFFLASLWGL
jgi:hypothetical protein